jgi:nuclear pore complex protein Nup205
MLLLDLYGSTVTWIRSANNLVVHYFPALSAFITRFGGSEPGRDLADARALNDKIFARVDDNNTWALTYVHATVKALWLAEYSGWYVEHSDGSIPDRQLADGKPSLPYFQLTAIEC